MQIKSLKAVAMILLPVALLVFTSCSSNNQALPSDMAPAYVPPTPAEPASPVFLGSGVAAGVASGVVQVEAIDYTNRTCLLGWPDGENVNFKVGPEYVNFDQVKVGDSFMSTVSKTFVAYLVKGDVAPSSVTNIVAQTKPAGSQPGGVMIRNVDYHAKVLEVNYGTRGVVLKYGVDEAKYVIAGPNVNLPAIHVNDDVFIRTTEAIAIAVVPP
jgi:hypothetical protein